MSKTIKETLSVTIEDTASSAKETINIGQLSDTFTGECGLGPGIVEVGTSEENVSFGDIGPGWIWMRNLDDTNYVQWGMSDGGTMKAVGRLRPQDLWTKFYLDTGVTLRMKADTAACKVLIKGNDA